MVSARVIVLKDDPAARRRDDADIERDRAAALAALEPDAARDRVAFGRNGQEIGPEPGPALPSERLRASGNQTGQSQDELRGGRVVARPGHLRRNLPPVEERLGIRRDDGEYPPGARGRVADPGDRYGLRRHGRRGDESGRKMLAVDEDLGDVLAVLLKPHVRTDRPQLVRRRGKCSEENEKR